MKIFQRLLTIILIGVTSFLLIMAGIYFYAKIQDKPIVSKSAGLIYVDRYGNTINNGSTSSDWAGIEEINNYLIKATLAIEDKNFYIHNGFDFPRILKAILVNIKNRSKDQGASTITQQYARSLYLTLDKTWTRKLNEAWYAVLLETHYKKNEILEGYLNTINYGHGVYGIQNASQFYFKKDAKDLTLAEASMLAGIPNRPSAYSPFINPDLAKNRQKTVLKLMVRNKYITQKQADEALKIELSYYGQKDPLDLQTLKYYLDAVKKELKSIKSIPETLLTSGGLRIYTTLDSDYQKKMESNIKKYLSTSELQTASIIMDQNNGEILALAGGQDFKKSQFNRAIDSKRQVGSTMKAFLYYAALQEGMTPSSTFISNETSFTFSDGTEYAPSNADNRYANGPISMAEAIALSDNIYAVKTHIFIGQEKLIQIARKVGITAPLEAIPSLPLGSKEISLIEMTTAYAHFANEGLNVDGHLIRRVEDLNGKLLYQRPLTTPTQVLDPDLTFILNYMMQGMFDYRMSSYAPVTGVMTIPTLSHQYAGKSGSTMTDSLMIGYNPELIMSVWIGYDDMKQLDKTSGEYQLSKKIWADTMEDIFRGREIDFFKPTPNVIPALVDPITGEQANSNTRNSIILYYLNGTSVPYSDLITDQMIEDSIKNPE